MSEDMYVSDEPKRLARVGSSFMIPLSGLLRHGA